MTYRVVWEPEAEDQLRSVRFPEDAAAIVRAVDRLAELGEGDLRRGRSHAVARVLVVSGYRVDLNLERSTRTIRVWGVRRATPRTK